MLHMNLMDRDKVKQSNYFVYLSISSAAYNRKEKIRKTESNYLVSKLIKSLSTRVVVRNREPAKVF